MTGVQLLWAQQCRAGVNVNLLLVSAESYGAGYVDDVQALTKLRKTEDFMDFEIESERKGVSCSEK